MALKTKSDLFFLQNYTFLAKFLYCYYLFKLHSFTNIKFALNIIMYRYLNANANFSIIKRQKSVSIFN